MVEQRRSSAKSKRSTEGKERTTKKGGRDERKRASAIGVKALRNTLSQAVAQKELPEDEEESTSSSYEYETDSEREFSPPGQGKEIPNIKLLERKGNS